MSQEQPRRRPQEGGGGGGGDYQEKKAAVIKYGDVFNVSGELALEIIAPGDAALMQIAETNMIGKTFPGGPAEKMLAAAAFNERTGVVDYADISDVVTNQGIHITETAFPAGVRIIYQSVGGQMLGRYLKPLPGEVLLEAAAGDKPVDQSDAAAVKAAEIRAIGSNVITPGGGGGGGAAAAAAAQSAANANARFIRDEEKCKLEDILTDAAAKLPADKPVTQGDAEEVMSAGLKNNPNLTTYHGGVMFY